MNISSIFRGTQTAAPSKADRSPKETAKIDGDYGTILDGFEQVGQSLNQIDSETQLKPASLANAKDSQLLLMGATAGAAVGGSIGLASNLLTSWASTPEVHVSSTVTDVNARTLVGHTEDRVPTYRDVNGYGQNGEPTTSKQLDGWDIKFKPTFTSAKVGTVTNQTATVEQGVGNPLGDALGGMALGAGVGTLLAGGVVITRKLTGKEQYVPGEARKTEGDLMLVAKMGAAGAAGGAAVGALSSMLANGNADTKTLTHETPLFDSKVVGQIPANYHQNVYQGGTTNPGTQAVTENVPRMEGGVAGHFQHLAKDVKTETVTAGGMSLGEGLLGGALAGAGIGVAAGVLTNVIRKTL